MKTVILAGGYGTRLSEETVVKPKPMTEIGARPILWHILKIYEAAGFKDFIIACGYRGDVIKEYFASFVLRNNDLIVDLGLGEVASLGSRSPDWRVACIDTGLETQTGGRLLLLQDHLESETFMVTYGDGVADLNIQRLLEFHKGHGRLATVTAVRPPPRFGSLELDGDSVSVFNEKLPTHAGWINGGFFVFEPQVLDYIGGTEVKLEAEPLATLAADRQLAAFRHDGFWKPVDTLREKQELESMWESGDAPWKIW